MVKVKEIMERNIASVCPSASVTEAARKMRDSQTGTVIVCENGKLRGIVTEERIISEIVAGDRNARRESVGSLMLNQLPKTTPGTEIAEAAKLMAIHGVQMLPVVHNGKLKGILTLDDLIDESPALAFMVFSKSTANGHRDKGGNN